MSERRPYHGYEPNEPTPPTGGNYAKKPLAPAKPMTKAEASAEGAGKTDRSHWSADAWEQPVQPERSYTQRTWDEEDYLPNEAPSDLPARPTKTEDAAPRRSRTDNSYTRPTWDETAYDAEQPNGDAFQTADGIATQYDRFGANSGEARNGVLSARFDRYGEIDEDSLPTTEQDAAFIANEHARVDTGAINRYARPAAGTPDGVSDLSARFAPPLKFELPRATNTEPRDFAYEPSQAEPNVYRTRQPAMRDSAGLGFDPTPRDAYRVEQDNASPRRRRRALKRLLAAMLIVAVIGGAAYLNRGWILEQLKPLLGEKAVESVNQVVNPSLNGAQSKTAAYDPAPVLQVSDQAKKGINAVAGGIGLEPYAVTNSNVIARVQTGENLYDYYLFAAGNGQLLGYYEGLMQNGFLVCANDVFYVAQSPYLIDSQGLPLIDASRYQQSVGADAVLGPMINGWSIISNAGRTAFNYINADGNMLSTLWFAKAYPFTGSSTLAYVDTGNVTDPEERFALYELNRTGGMTMWRHAANMDDVLGCASNVAIMSTGELIRLDGSQTVLCTADDVSAYVDCGAIVARDPATGKYGLFVNGEQHYDFAYDNIGPVASDIQWARAENGLYKQYTVIGLAYPLPLSHYFALQKGEEQEMVALSTGSVYPLLLNDVQ